MEPAMDKLPDFRAVFDAMPGAHLLFLADDPVFTVAAVTEGYLQARNMSRPSVVNHNVVELFDGGSDAIMASLRRAIESRAADQTSTPILNGNGGVQYVLHTPADVRLAETNLRNTEILESIADGFFTLDRDWRFVYVNAAAERMLGTRREELLGRNHWETYPATLGTVGEREYRRAVREQV